MEEGLLNLSGTTIRLAGSCSWAKFILRFHGEGQRSEIKARAALNKRSMNAEILILIEQALAASKPGLPSEQP